MDEILDVIQLEKFPSQIERIPVPGTKFIATISCEKDTDSAKNLTPNETIKCTTATKEKINS
jgi:hypothetical protein